MVELKLGLKTVDLPYSIRIPNVSERMFDELVDEDTRAELINGVMVVHSPASPRHGIVSGFLRTLMLLFAERKELGKVLGPDTFIHLATCRLFAPDLFFYHKTRLPKRLPRKQFEGAPDLVGEVLSPSNRVDDIEDKWPAYREAGVKEIWIVDLENEKLLVDRRRGSRDVTTPVAEGRVESAVLHGFWIDARWLWAEPVPNVTRCFHKILV